MGKFITKQAFREFLWSEKAKIKSAIRPESGLKFESVCHMITATRNAVPKLQECSNESILLAACQGLTLGLEPNNAQGHFYLVPYKGTCDGQIGYKGLIQLCYRSGQVRSIETRNAFENEEFKVDWGMTPPIFHTPMRPSMRGAFLCSYVKICTTAGGEIYDLMWDEEIDIIKNRSPAFKAGAGPWKTDELEMNRKTVTKRGLKYVPSSARLTAALAADDLADVGLLMPEGDDMGSGPDAPPDDAGESDMDALARKNAAKRGSDAKKGKADMKPASGTPRRMTEPGDLPAGVNEKRPPRGKPDDLMGEKVRCKNMWAKCPEETRAGIMLGLGLDDTLAAIDGITSGPELVMLYKAFETAKSETEKGTTDDAPDVDKEGEPRD